MQDLGLTPHLGERIPTLGGAQAAKDRATVLIELKVNGPVRTVELVRELSMSGRWSFSRLISNRFKGEAKA